MTENPKQDQPTPEQGARLRALPWYVFIPLVGVVVLAMIGLAALTGTLPTPTGTQVAQASPSAPATVAPIVVTATPDPNATAAPSTTPVLILITVTPSITPTPSATNTPTATATLTATLTSTPTPTPTPTLDPISIVQGLNPMGKLVAVEVPVGTSNLPVAIVMNRAIGGTCTVSAKHEVRGVIEAGVEMRGFTVGDVAYDAASDTYTITLPAPQLTHCTTDAVNIRQYDVVQPFGCPGFDLDEMRRFATYQALRLFQSEAIEGGILQTAEVQVRLVLSNFVRVLTGARNVVIVFDPDRQPALPLSCSQPNVPGGWVFNPASGLWERP
jgi:hypothetical protein